MHTKNYNNNKFLLEACRIGDELLFLAKKEKIGCSWETAMKPIDKVVWVKDNSMYPGVPGISLFLLELFRITKQKKYKIAALDGLAWSKNEWVNSSNEQNSNGFYCGPLSCAMVFVRAWQILKDDKLLLDALQLANTLNVYSQVDGYDLMYGLAGTAWALIYLYNASQEPELLTKLSHVIENLLSKTIQHIPYIYWGRPVSCSYGLCGFSHGVSGVALLFLELYKFTGNSVFKEISRQGFLFEKEQFVTSKQSWKDNRYIYGTDEKWMENEKKEVISGNILFFKQENDFCAWCHGANGIGLARIEAYELLKKKEYLKDYEIALKRTELEINKFDARPTSYTLCHGLSGNASFFISAYRHFKKEEYLHNAERIGMKILESKNEIGNYQSGLDADSVDYSLFNGIAGIGYFFLQLVDPQNCFFFLCPTTNNSSKSNEDPNIIEAFSKFNKKYIQKQFLTSTFPRTICLLEKAMNKADYNKWLDKQTMDLSEIIRNIPKLFSLFDDNIYKCMSESFSFEKKIKKFDKHFPFSYLDRREKLFQNVVTEIGGVEKIIDQDILLEMNQDILIVNTKWNWVENNNSQWLKNMTIAPSDNYLLMHPTLSQTTIKYLTPFSYIVLNTFKKRNKPSDCINFLLKRLSAEGVSLSELKSTIKSQINIFLNAGILIPDCHSRNPITPTINNKKDVNYNIAR